MDCFVAREQWVVGEGACAGVLYKCITEVFSVSFYCSRKEAGKKKNRRRKGALSQDNRKP
ncbi:hypothetical protein HPP92_024752 [Vanilla planifolia]|uniref:Uncharacterized protein n=1 Tax=Vanilla planifolia TaxID=51239 RepID=A0A835PIT0_VANPL|nr:hypothetical protein HPP92_025055 [Vanilla planifolia]KAG0453448.1 hypothetical protein HPP92_024752 [Vanilla planifolia]